MEESSRSDIRRLLKIFGVQADEAVINFLRQNSSMNSLHIRLTLTDLTDYGDSLPEAPLSVEVEGEIRR
jgi:hypothetical protein